MTDNVVNLFHLNQKKTFTEDEAMELINYLLPITSKAKNKINGLKAQQQHFQNVPNQARALENRVNQEVQIWSEKVRRLGGSPTALYEVEIPSSQGHYTWTFPEAELK